MNCVEVRVFNESGLDLPQYATPGSSGMDICAKIDVTVYGKCTTIVPTGLFFQIPAGFEIQIRPRSGLSLKTGIRIANSPGTIDSDYRGELCAIVWNTSEVDYIVKRGERIAQIVLCEVPRIQWTVVPSGEALESTVRGSGGFGSTGK